MVPNKNRVVLHFLLIIREETTDVIIQAYRSSSSSLATVVGSNAAIKDKAWVRIPFYDGFCFYSIDGTNHVNQFCHGTKEVN